MDFLLVVFIIMISIGLFSLAVIPVSSVELVIDDMNEITDWTNSGGASPLKLSSTDNQKTHSFYLEKLDIKSDWARYTKKLKTGQNYSNYEKVSYSVYIPDSKVVKQISAWFGEKKVGMLGSSITKPKSKMDGTILLIIYLCSPQ